DDVGAARIGGLGERVAHAAARRVGDDAHGVEMLTGGAGGHDDVLPLPRRSLQQQPLRRRENGLGLAHPAGTVARSLGEGARVRPHQVPAARDEPFQVGARRGMGVHRVVHRGRGQHGPRPGEQQRGEHVVREPLIARMEAAGAVLVGALNMGEYAYDFTGENVHDGPSRNPHDPTRMTGGSSGGSGASVGGGLVPLALGSDTNGSIRVPSSFCGIFGLKPTYGRLSRARSFPFVASFDHLGPFARSVADLALAYDAMQGPDSDDAACTTRPVEPVTAHLVRDIARLRIAIAGGYFQKNLFAEAEEAVARIAKALDVTRTVELPEAARARAA